MGSNPKSVGFIMTSFNKVNDFEWFQSSIFTVPYCMKLFAFFATSMFCTLHRRNNSLHPCYRAFRVSSITKWVQSFYQIALTFWRIKFSDPFSDNSLSTFLVCIKFSYSQKGQYNSEIIYRTHAIISRSCIQGIHKDRIFWKNSLKTKKWSLEMG